MWFKKTNKQAEFRKLAFELGYTELASNLYLLNREGEFKAALYELTAIAEDDELKGALKARGGVHVHKNPPKTAIPKVKKPRKVGITTKAQDC